MTEPVSKRDLDSEINALAESGEVEQLLDLLPQSLLNWRRAQEVLLGAYERRIVGEKSRQVDEREIQRLEEEKEAVESWKEKMGIFFKLQTPAQKIAIAAEPFASNIVQDAMLWPVSRVDSREEYEEGLQSLENNAVLSKVWTPDPTIGSFLVDQYGILSTERDTKKVLPDIDDRKQLIEDIISATKGKAPDQLLASFSEELSRLTLPDIVMLLNRSYESYAFHNPKEFARREKELELFMDKVNNWLEVAEEIDRLSDVEKDRLVKVYRRIEKGKKVTEIEQQIDRIRGTRQFIWTTPEIEELAADQEIIQKILKLGHKSGIMQRRWAIDPNWKRFINIPLKLLWKEQKRAMQSHLKRRTRSSTGRAAGS